MFGQSDVCNCDIVLSFLHSAGTCTNFEELTIVVFHLIAVLPVTSLVLYHICDASLQLQDVSLA